MDRIEQWAPIPGYEGYYLVSTMGNIRSVDRMNSNGKFLTGRALIQHKNPNGYPTVTLSRDGSGKTKLVHSLVLRAFAGEPLPGHETRHLNGVRDDNRLVNLAWGTRCENRADTKQHGNDRNARKTHCDHGHALHPWNLVKKRKNGHRNCLACNRAWGYSHSRKIPFTIDLANRYYEQLRDQQPPQGGFFMLKTAKETQ